MKRKQPSDSPDPSPSDIDVPMDDGAMSPIGGMGKHVSFADSRVFVQRPKKPARALDAATSTHDMGGSVEESRARFKEYEKEVEATDALKEVGFWLAHDYVKDLNEIDRVVRATRAIEEPYAPGKSVDILIQTMERGIEDAKDLIKREPENRKIYARLQGDDKEVSEDFPDPKENLANRIAERAMVMKLLPGVRKNIDALKLRTKSMAATVSTVFLFPSGQALPKRARLAILRK